MALLLAQAEKSLAAATRRTHNWLPETAHTGAQAAQLAALSSEALDELAGLADAVSENEAQRHGAAPDAAAVEAAAPAANHVAESHNGKGLTCITCAIAAFEDRAEQVGHFGGPWHNANVKRRRAGRSPWTEADFASAEAEGAADETEVSEAKAEALELDKDDEDETDDDGDDDEEAHAAEEGVLPRDMRSSTVEVGLCASRSVSLSAALLGAASFVGGRQAKALTQASAAAGLRRLAALRRRPGGLRTCVVALRSGKFAAALFDGAGRVEAHRTFARYTTRKGQGGAQSTMDGSGKAPKSIGSTLRRQGERALADEVRALLLDEWAELLARCDIIFVAAARTMRPLLLGEGATAPFDAHDARVQAVPFAVYKPTLVDVVAAHARLMTFVVHPRRLETAPPPPPAAAKALPAAPAAVSVPEAASDEGEVLSESTRLLHAACAAGDAAAVETLLAQPDVDVNAVAHGGARALHVAAAAGAADVVELLLLKGDADPAALDYRERPPFFFASDKKTREAFRSARAQLGEESRDWLGSAVPEPLDDETKAAKKAKDLAKKKRQRDRQKVDKDAFKAAELLARETAAAAEVQARAQALLDAKADACAQCQAPVRHSRQAFTRMDFKYCSADCAAAHRRAQCAAAAEKRFSQAR
ncbi:hypothetical protein M885DRAFT_622065 [Pelagophyceae sp. CCMP2097]|nr:hypothetical protein M885DRAFT_622065 [Pelagophyceae sp. CCMP2097]